MGKTRVVQPVTCPVCQHKWWANHEEGERYVDCDSCGCSMPLPQDTKNVKRLPSGNSEDGIRCMHTPRGVHFHIWGGPRDGEVMCHTKGPLPTENDSFLIDGRTYVMETFTDGKMRAVDYGEEKP